MKTTTTKNLKLKLSKKQREFLKTNIESKDILCFIHSDGTFTIPKMNQGE